MSMISMLHSVSYSGSWGQTALSVEQFVERANELGFSGVMLMAKRPHLSVLDWNTRECVQLRKRLEKARVKKVCIAGYNNFTADLEHADVPHCEIQIQHVTELARIARDLGGDLVRVFTGYDHPASPFLPQWKIVVRALKECSKRAADFGVTIGVQNHHDIGVHFQSQLDLIRAVDEPNCRAMFDAWAPALQGADLASAAKRLAPVAVQTTIADYQRRPRFRYDPHLVNYTAQTPYVQAVPVGEGFIDYRSFFKELRCGGFTGNVAYEMCSPLLEGGSSDVLDRYARKFLEFLDEISSEASSIQPTHS